MGVVLKQQLIKSIYDYLQIEEIMWQGIYNSLTILVPNGHHIHPLPTDSVLDAYEQNHSIALPISYREYIKVFGAGELGNHFRLTAPGYKNRGRKWSPSIANLNEQWHTNDTRFASDHQRDLEFVTSLHYFCTPPDGDVIGWSLRKQSVGKAGEYPIYLRIRPFQFIHLTDKFDHFVTEFCLGRGFDNRLREEGFAVDNPSDIQHAFMPITISYKAKLNRKQ